MRGMFAGFVILGVVVSVPSALADEPSAVAPIMKLLQSGRLPPERQGTVVEMVCKRGNSADLAYIFAQLQKPGVYSPALRLQVLEWLTDAAATRKMKPAGDLSALSKLTTDDAGTSDPA